MRAGRPRSLLLLPSKERGHLARRSRDGSATLLPWERRRPRRQERWRWRSRPTRTSAFPGDKPFVCNQLTPKIKTKRTVKSQWHWARTPIRPGLRLSAQNKLLLPTFAHCRSIAEYRSSLQLRWLQTSVRTSCIHSSSARVCSRIRAFPYFLFALINASASASRLLMSSACSAFLNSLCSGRSSVVGSFAFLPVSAS